MWTFLSLSLACGQPNPQADPAPSPARGKAKKSRGRDAPPRGPRSEGVVELTFPMGALQRKAYVRLPSTYAAEPERRWPVLVTFHGGRGRGSAQSLMPAWEAHRDRFIQVFPEGQHVDPQKGAWWSPDDQPTTDAFVDALLDRIDADYRADPERRYATGFSAGALFTYKLACTSDRFRGFAVSSHPISAEMPARCAPVARPFLLSSGTDDKRFDGHRTQSATYLSIADTAAFWAKINGCEGSPSGVRIEGQPGDPTQPTRYSYTSCRSAFRYIEIAGAGHTWPGQKATGSDEEGVRSTFLLADEVVAFFEASAGL